MRGDFLKENARGIARRKVDKICTACDWKGVVSSPSTKCPECGNCNLKIES